jgi:acetyl-CoA synthetase
MSVKPKIIEKPYGKKDAGKHNFGDYDKTRKTFKWEDVKKNFSWYKTKKVNMAYECIDRHCKDNGDKIALIYSSDDRNGEYTFDEMRRLSNRFANVLKKYGIKKGDRVFIFMPRSPELYVSVMGILKVGAIVGPLFEAFMEEAVKDRMLDSDANTIITTPELRPRIPIKDLPDLRNLIYVLSGRRLEEVEMKGQEEVIGESGMEEMIVQHKLDEDVKGVKLIHYEAEMERASDEFGIKWVDLEDPLILHYTSGSTGKPKGVIHVHNAMVGHYQTAKWSLDLQEDDIYWCTADPGWVTGTSYGIFGPWLNGVTNLIRGGRFSVDSWYQTIQDNKVTVWYSAPTAFRLLMAEGAEKAKKYDLGTLRHVCSVGEPLNPEVVYWGLEAYDLPIHDNWWMTETGMQLIANYPAMPIRPGSMGKPFPGTEAAIVDDTGKVVPPLTMGNLAIRAGWPSMMRGIWKNEERYKGYFKLKPWYISGDSAYMDKDGYFWFQGRIDDVIKTSGERVGPFEVESALVEHPAVAEAGVIGKPDPIRGEIIKAFVTLRPGFKPSEELKKEIADYVKNHLAAHAKPREIEFIDHLPKTRSGKIMRRVLKARELGLPTGDLSTMADE